jgi:lysozyme
MSDDGVALTKQFEGFRATRYMCPAGKATIGYGHVIAPGEVFGTITEAAATILLMQDLAVRAIQLMALLVRQPTQGQFDAMLDMVYNIGVGVHDGKKGDFADSDLLMYFNQGDDAAAIAEFPKWCKYRDPSTGVLKVLLGLLRRRLAEQALYRRGHNTGTTT